MGDTYYDCVSLRKSIKKVLSYNNDLVKIQIFVDHMDTPELVNYTCAEIFVKEVYNNEALKIDCAIIKQAYLDVHTNGMFNYTQDYKGQQ